MNYYCMGLVDVSLRYCANRTNEGLIRRKWCKQTKYCSSKALLRYDLPNGLTYLQLGRDFINLFLFKYMPF